MAALLMDSSGFEIGGYSIPSFRLHAGESLTFAFPDRAGHHQELVVKHLTGSRAVPGLVCHASVMAATPAAPSSGWARWFRNLTPLGWLRKNTPLAEEPIRRILTEHGFKPDLPLSAYAGTPRALLGLERAYALGAQVVIFSTVGLDPLGVERVFRVVEKHLPSCSAIYLARPALVDGRESYQHLGGSTRISVGFAPPYGPITTPTPAGSPGR